METNYYSIDREICIGCGSCVAVCRHGAASLHEGVACIDPALCRACAACADGCPAGAIYMVTVASPAIPARVEQPWPAVQRFDSAPVERVDRQMERPVPSLFTRVVRRIAPALLSVAVGVGQAWLERAADPAEHTPRASPRCGAPTRRRARWRGRV